VVGRAEVTGRAGDVSDAEAVAATATVDFLEAVREMEFQMLDMDLGPADLSFLSNGFKCEALTVAIHLLLFVPFAMPRIKCGFLGRGPEALPNPCLLLLILLYCD
jgi:hypothetical protein